MTPVCPACQVPIDEEATLDSGQKSGTVVCANCGAEVTIGQETSTCQYTPELTANQRVANFTLVRLLGQGGFGAVWLAQDQDLGRPVALKLPKASRKDAKLLHEAQTAAKLRHPNIVAIYEVGLDKDQIFIASEYIDGQDLRSELARGRPKIPRAVKLIATLARAIQHAHEHGVVHRDLKPANIMLNSEGEPFITDFGIAKQLTVDETISTDGQVIGTISYMSPEQARGNTRDTDHRADIYALGVMLFEMLTEYQPFRGNARAVIHQKIEEDAPSPRKLVPSLPKDLETICLKCLEREPSKRYATAAELASELERFEQGVPIQARPISRAEKLWRWCRRKPAVASLVAGLFLSLTLGLMGVSYFWREAVHSADETRVALYRSNMHLASKLWERGDIAGLRQTLQKYKAPSQSADLRGFEWHYFNTLTESFAQITNHGEAVTDVAVSHDGGLFASAGSDRAIRVWDSQTGELVRTLQLDSGRVETIEFSPIDDRLLSAHSDGIVRLWNPTQHDHAARELQHGNGLTLTRFAQDGRFLVSGGRDGVVRYWKVSSEEQVATLSEGRSGVSNLRLSPDGQTIAIATEDGTVTLWDPGASKSTRQWQTRLSVSALAFVDNGQTLATGGLNGLLQFWSVETGERLAVVPTEGGAIGDLEYLATGGLLAVVTTNGELTLLDSQRHSVRSLVTHALTHGMLAQSADGSAIVAGSGDGSVKLLKAGSLHHPDVLWHATHVRDVEFINDKEVVACDGEGAVQIWDVSTGSSRELVPASGREMLALAVRSDDQLLAVGGMSREIGLLHWQSSKHNTISLPIAGISALCFSPDGRKLACGGRNGAVRVYEGSFDKPVFESTTPDAQVNDLLFCKDNSLVVSYSNGRIDFLNSMDGSPSGSPIEVAANPLALASCAEGEQLAVGMGSGELHLFDSRTRRLLRVIKAHSSRINDLAIFPDGRRLVSGGRDKELRIWDVASGELIASLAGHRRQVFSIAISPSGNTIVSAGLAGDIRLWRTASR